MKKIIISAVGQNGVIGKNGDLPWHSKEEFQHFKNTTLGHPMIMGRITFDSLKVPLKGRRHLIVTHNKDLKYPFEEVEIFGSIKEALENCEGKNLEKVFIIGGGEIYRQSMDFVDELLISVMHFKADGDTYFPQIDKNVWKEESKENRSEFDIIRYVKK